MRGLFILLVILLVVLIFTCCKKHEESASVSEKIPYLSQIYIDNNLYKEYFYNDNWQPSAIRIYNGLNNFITDSVFYNSANSVSKYSTYLNNGSLQREHVYEYDPEGKVVSDKYFEAYRGVLFERYYFEYFYNSNNLLFFKTSFSTSDKKKVLSWSYHYDERGNLIKFTDYVHINGNTTPSPGPYTRFEYDNFKNLSIWFNCNYYIPTDLVPVVNNITQTINYTTEGDTAIGSYSAVFTYSSDGVPLTERRAFKDSHVQFFTYKYMYR